MLGTKEGKRLGRYKKDYVVFDLETTGISPNYDEVVEISALKVRDGKVVEEFSTLVNPKRRIPYGASSVNGITDEMVADAPVFSEVLEQFYNFVGDDVLVGHNIHTFDMKFLYRDSLRYFGQVPDNDYVDTLMIARNCLPGLRHHRLTDLAQHYGLSTVGAHRALKDCYMNQQVFEKLAEELKPLQAKAAGRVCPVCGNPMKKRSGRYGEFWGCTGFPACRHTERI